MNPISRYFYKIIDFLLPSHRYPFELPPGKNPDHISSLPELLEEPYGIINGHTITFWFYVQGKGINSKIVEVMEAGHSNTSICSRVSALIHETLLELESINILLYTAGSLWIKIDNDNVKNQEKLRFLENQLRILESETGLVKVFRADYSDLDVFRKDLCDQNKKYSNTKTLYRSCKIEQLNDKPLIFDYIGYPLPNSGHDISFVINRSVYENETFRKLSYLHEASFRSFRIRDIVIRSETYAKWLLRDIYELTRLMNQQKIMRPKLWIANIIPYSGVRDYYIGEASEGKGNLDPFFRNIQELYSEWSRLFDKDQKSSEKIEKRLFQAVQNWEINVAQIKHDLDYGLTNHANRLSDTAPYFIIEDIRWLMKMIRILIFEHDDEQSAILKMQQIFKPIIENLYQPIPLHIRKQFDDAFNVTDINNLWIKLQSVIDIWVKITDELPLSLTENIEPIFKELSEIKKDMENRQRRMEFNLNVNERILIDAMIRGWPSFFLNTKELREIYDTWVDQVRDSIWKEIRFQLLTNKVKMYPFTEENISFRILSLNDNYIKIIPFFGINSYNYYIFYHHKIGTPHYLSTWNHKEIEYISENKTNIDISSKLMIDYWEAIKDNKLSNAIELFNLALKFQPVRACSEFFTKLWDNLGNISDPNIEGALLLQRGIKLTENEKSYKNGLKYLRKYIEKYPDYLADPYVYLALGETRYKLLHEQTNYQNSVKHYNNYIKRLDIASQRSNATKAVATNIPQMGKLLDTELIKFVENIKSSDIKIIHLEKSISEKSAIEILNLADQYITDFNSFNLNNYDEFKKFIIFQMIVSGFGNALKKDIKELKKKIHDFESQIENLTLQLWRNLPMKEYYRRALILDSNYTENILTKKALFSSPKFQLEYEPYLNLNIADSKMRIAIFLQFWVSELKEKGINELHNFNMAASFIDKIKILDQEPLGVSEDEKEKIEKIIKSKIERIIEKPEREDSLTRLDLLSEVESIASSFMSSAINLYETSHAMLPSFSPAYMKSMELRCVLFPLYLKTLQQISKQITMPLEIAYPEVTYSIEKDTQVEGRIIPYNIIFEGDDKIVAYSKDNEILALLKLNYTDDNRISIIKQRISNQIQESRFRNNLFPLTSSLANRILKTCIEISPVTKAILNTLLNSLRPLTFILAYMGARMAPPMSDTSYGVKVLNRELLKYFIDTALYTEKQQMKNEEYLKKLDNGVTVNRIIIDIDKIFNKLRNKKGYMF